MYDLYIAGAGLAAHLPGVVASLTKKPVIGIPVDSVFSGLDSLFSIVQMPFGVPVLTVGPNKEGEISSFLLKLNKLSLEKTIHLVTSSEKLFSTYKREYERFQELATKLGFVVMKDGEASDDKMCFYYQDDDNYSVQDFGISIPVIEKSVLTKSEKALDLFKWISQGGFWVGVNNSRNALLWFEKFLNLKG